MEQLWETIERDKKTFAQKGNVEKLFIIELARVWIGMHAKDKTELSEKVSALAEILHTSEFQEVTSISKELSRDFDAEKAGQAADLIVKLSQSEIYAKYSPVAGYQLLDKFKTAQTYRTQDFVIHSNQMLGLCDYLMTLI